MILYHNHIPRTAGTFIQAPLSGLLTSKGVKYSIVHQADHINNDKMIASKHIFGHIGCYPETIINNITTYGVVRNPLDRFISTFNFFSKNIFYVNPTEELLEQWVYDDKYFSYHSNLQSRFVTGYSDIHAWNASNRQERVKNGWYIKNYSEDISVIKNKIDHGYWVSMENKNILLDWLAEIHEKEYGFRLYNRRYPINESERLNFNISNKIKNRIIELNQIDYELYDYVCSKTTLNGV